MCVCVCVQSRTRVAHKGRIPAYITQHMRLMVGGAGPLARDELLSTLQFGCEKIFRTMDQGQGLAERGGWAA